MIKVTILTPDRILFEGDVWSVFLPGATGEFEVLPFHKPVISLLREGTIIVDWKMDIPIRAGTVRMAGDRLVALVEE